MTLDARSVAFAIGDAKMLILLALGYISSVGVTYLLCAAFNNKIKLRALIQSAAVVTGAEYAVSLLLGSVFWYALLAYPALLWIPISLFLIISLGAAA